MDLQVPVKFVLPVLLENLQQLSQQEDWEYI